MTIFDEIYQYFKANPDELAFMWTRFNWTYPPPQPFLECAFRGRDFVALYEGQPAPPPSTIRVKVNSANGLRVRSAPVTGAILTVLPNNTIIEVFEAQETAGWYELSSGTYARGYVSDAYVEKVTDA